jgi:hypothetical protein
MEEARVKLKQKFIGIDTMIDGVIDTIMFWYLAPELQIRPLTICLWGITGVGKTDLVRSLVSYLGLMDKFVEVQMDIDKNHTGDIESLFECNQIVAEDPAVLLLDEMQRFRTIDEEGHLIKNASFNDVWTLLSDGKFSSSVSKKIELNEMMLDYIYQDANKNKNKKTETLKNILEEDEKQDHLVSAWQATRLKKLLRSPLSVENIMNKTCQERIQLIKVALSSTSLVEGTTYNKLLIFISGNLDSAYSMANAVGDADIDADIYNRHSLNITVVDIKKQLAKQFKPENIARFGNNHFIYPCLTKKNYKDLIQTTTNHLCQRVKNSQDISINLTQNVLNIIYENGVFPAQGVRPVFSTISQILESNLPYFMFQAIAENCNNFILDFDTIKSTLHCQINGKLFEKTVKLFITSIKKAKSKDLQFLLAVHELGHALIYSLLFKRVPAQLNFNAVSHSEAFIATVGAHRTKKLIEEEVSVLLAGLIIEELLFGKEHRSLGSVSDTQVATNLIGNYIRYYAMNGTISTICNPGTSPGESLNYDIDATNIIMEHLLQDAKKRTEDLINNNIALYKELLSYVISVNFILNDNYDWYSKIFSKYGIELEISTENIIYTYKDVTLKFLNIQGVK